MPSEDWTTTREKQRARIDDLTERLEAAESALREISDAANLIGPGQPNQRAERLSKVREILARSQIEGSNYKQKAEAWRADQQRRHPERFRRSKGATMGEPITVKPRTRFRQWRSRSWPIRLRCALLIPGTHRWNAWLRDITARMERRGIEGSNDG